MTSSDDLGRADLDQVSAPQEDTFFPCRDGFEREVDGVVLVVAGFPGAALVFERDVGEAVAPFVLFGEGAGPEFIGGR